MCLLPLRSVLFMAPSARLRAWLVARVRAVGCNRDDSRELLFDWRINVHRGAFFNFWGSYCCGFGVQITVGLIGYTSICYFGHIYGPEREGDSCRVLFLFRNYWRCLWKDEWFRDPVEIYGSFSFSQTMYYSNILFWRCSASVTVARSLVVVWLAANSAIYKYVWCRVCLNSDVNNQVTAILRIQKKKHRRDVIEIPKKRTALIIPYSDKS
jgi:hypothetical protein